MIDFHLFQQMLESYEANKVEAQQNLAQQYQNLYGKVKDLHFYNFCVFAHQNKRVEIDFYISERAEITFYQTLYMTELALKKLLVQYPNDVVLADFSIKWFLHDELTYGKDYVFENYDIHCAYIYKKHSFPVCFTKNRIYNKVVKNELKRTY